MGRGAWWSPRGRDAPLDRRGYIRSLRLDVEFSTSETSPFSSLRPVYLGSGKLFMHRSLYRGETSVHLDIDKARNIPRRVHIILVISFHDVTVQGGVLVLRCYTYGMAAPNS